VLSINGILVGSYIQAAWLTNAHVIVHAYTLGALTLLPLALVAITPWLTGHMHLSYLNNTTFPANGASPLSFAGLGIFFATWFLGGWSAYVVESAAAFTPEYKHPEVETPKALRRAGMIQILIFGLVPLALVGTVGQAVIAGAPYVAFVPVLHTSSARSAQPWF
jgi:amino acid transporter